MEQITQTFPTYICMRWQMYPVSCKALPPLTISSAQCHHQGGTESCVCPNVLSAYFVSAENVHMV